MIRDPVNYCLEREFSRSKVATPTINLNMNLDGLLRFGVNFLTTLPSLSMGYLLIEVARRRPLEK